MYVVTAVIASSLFVLYSFVQHFIDWNKILNVSSSFDENIALVVWISIGLFCLQLVLKNITTIFLAVHLPAVSDAILFGSNLLVLIVLFALYKLNIDSLMAVALVFMVAPVIIYSVSSLYFFKGILSEFRPKMYKIERFYFNDLMILGVKFFFIQITSVVMFASGNILIAQMYGPADVSPYNIAFRLFSTTLVVFTIIMTPFWSAYTEAFTKNDFLWIRESLKNLIKLWIVFSLLVVVLFFISPWVFHYWIGDLIAIPTGVSLSFMFYAILLAWSGLYAQFLNGIGIIRVQLYIAIFQLISNIPLAIYFAKYLGFGVSGIIMATNINLFISGVILACQVYKICNQKAVGFWLR